MFSPAPSSPQSAQYACQGCKKQKVKCDRTLPICSRCSRIEQDCVYPSSAKKPGPKIGTSQPLKRRRTSDWTNEVDDVESSNSLDGKSRNIVPEWNEPTGTREDRPWAPLPPTVPPVNFHTSQLPAMGGTNKDIIASQTPRTTSSTTLSTESPTKEARTLSQAIHPSHDPITRANSRNGHREPIQDFVDITRRNRMIFRACEVFKISIETYQYLVSSYFENMTAFSLFNRPQFDSKLQSISSEDQVHALLAAMFSIAACFPTTERERPHVQIPSSRTFHDLSSRFAEGCLDECSDRAPSLGVLQVLILNTFQQLIRGVRGRSWRALGTCVRIAYELQLHCIDAKESENAGQTVLDGTEMGISDWQAKEERRRAWWAIWEFDVFASTIRRLPTAIDWSQNFTWLPVDDDLWYANVSQPSCFLAQEPTERAISLQRCGNEGGKAWFIVINSLTRIGQSFPFHNSNINSPTRGGAATSHRPLAPKDIYADNASFLVSTLRSFSQALPSTLCYNGEYLSFSSNSDVQIISTTRSKDHDRYSIHMMKQLAVFVLHRQVFLAASGMAIASPDKSFAGHVEAFDQGSWKRYLEAIENVVRLVRNSAEDHVYYVNPFLVNTVWFAAAAQITYKLYGPSSLCTRAVADANFELLRSNLIHHVHVWDISGILLEKLDALESRLVNLAIPLDNASRRDGQNGSKRQELQSYLKGNVQQEPTAAFHDHDLTSMEAGFSTQGSYHGFVGPLPIEWDTFDFLGLDQLLSYDNFG